MEDLMYYIALGLIITFSLIRKIGKAAAKKSKGGNVHQTAPTPQTTGASLSEIFKEMERVAKAQAEQAKALETRINELLSGDSDIDAYALLSIIKKRLRDD